MGEKATNCCNLMALGSNKHPKMCFILVNEHLAFGDTIDDEAKRCFTSFDYGD